MNASAAFELTSEQEIVLMRKLKYLSEEHRNYLLKTYDLVGISKRINRYLSMTRKENTLKQHEAQCEKIYHTLRRGYFVENLSVFDSYDDPKMYQYTTERCYNTDDNVEELLQKPQVVKHENIDSCDNKAISVKLKHENIDLCDNKPISVKVKHENIDSCDNKPISVKVKHENVDKRISLTEYRKRKTHDVEILSFPLKRKPHDSTVSTSLKCKSDEVALLPPPRKRKYTCDKIETSPLHYNDTKKPKRFFETNDCGSNAKKIKYNICDPQTFCNDKMNIPLQ